MDKKLPSVFANKIDKKLSNNNDFYYGKEERTIEQPKSKFDYLTEKSVDSKVNSIFTSKNYIYKANVVITTKNGKVNKTIVGKNKNNLITIDNELIDIDGIVDIEIAK